MGARQVLLLFLVLDRTGVELQTPNRQTALLVGGVAAGQISLQWRLQVGLGEVAVQAPQLGQAHLEAQAVEVELPGLPLALAAAAGLWRRCQFGD